MDLAAYCREHNRVDYNSFINHLASLDVVLIGENHFNKVHTSNEERIITSLFEAERKINLLTEDHGDSEKYKDKRDMIAKFDFDNYIIVGNENESMADAIKNNFVSGNLNLAILGRSHTTGFPSVGDLVKRMNNDISLSTVNLLSHLPNGIYLKRTIENKDYIISGRS